VAGDGDRAIALSMSVLVGSIANIALPTIARDMRATPADSIWVVNAYQFAVTISLLPLASIGDIHGHRRVYSLGLARGAGLWRRRHHERERRAGAFQLPA
jgi:MFS family permease